MFEVTVAICTWNRRSLLEQTLTSMEKLRVGDIQWELIVIDNGSSDDTAGAVRGWMDRASLPLRYVLEPKLGLSNARNRALLEARADWVLFADDDVLVDLEWLSAFKAASERYPQAGAIGGRVDPWFVEKPDVEMSQAFPALADGFCAMNFGPEDQVVPAGMFLGGGNFAVRISAADLTFEVNLGRRGRDLIGGEENVFQARLRQAGLDVIWWPAMRLQHYVDPKRMTLSYLRPLYLNLGRDSVRMNGIPKGARIAGVPRWLLRSYLAHSFARLSSVVRGNRVAALTALRQRDFVQGMIIECRRRTAGA